MTQRLSRILSLIGLATSIAACGGSDSTTMTVSGRLVGAAQAQGGLAASALEVAGGRVDIQEVWMVIRDIKFGVPGVDGEINAGTLIMEEGAFFEGNLKMGGRSSQATSTEAAPAIAR